MSSYSALILSEPTLQSYWRFNEPSGNAVDSGPGGIAGTVNASVSRSQPSLLASDADFAMGFPGTAGANVDFGDNYDFTGSFTIEFWIRLTSTPTGTHRMLDKLAASNLGGFTARYDNGATSRFHCIRFDAAGASDSANGPTLATNGPGGFPLGPHHVVYTYNGTTLTTYTNGVAGTGTASSRVVPDVTDTLRFGSDRAGGNGPVAVGDELAIYSSGLSPASVLAHYNAGIAVPDITLPTFARIRFNG